MLPNKVWGRMTLNRKFKVMVAVKRSAGVATEVNMRNSLHVDDEACKQRVHHPGLEIWDRRHWNSKTGVSLA